MTKDAGAGSEGTAVDVVANELSRNERAFSVHSIGIDKHAKFPVASEAAIPPVPREDNRAVELVLFALLSKPPAPPPQVPVDAEK